MHNEAWSGRTLVCFIAPHRATCTPLMFVSTAGSWRLRERGIGIQQIMMMVEKSVCPINVTIMDNTTASTAKQAKKVADEFSLNVQGVIRHSNSTTFLKSKELMLVRLSLASTHATLFLLGVPTDLFRLLMRLRTDTHKEVIVQTRTETDNLMIHATRGAIERFMTTKLPSVRCSNTLPQHLYSTTSLDSGTSTSVLELEKPIKLILENQSVNTATIPTPPTAKLFVMAIRIPNSDKNFTSPLPQSHPQSTTLRKNRNQPRRIV